MKPIRVMAAVLALGLSGCATGQLAGRSYVAPLAADDANAIAKGVTGFLARQFPAASSTIVLEPTLTNQNRNQMTPVLVRDLRQHGFAVSAVRSPGAHQVRYWITPLDQSGELVRLDIDGHIVASQFFARDDAGRLQADGPITVLKQDAAG